MRVCLILEGCYPYVRGGVSTWAQEYMSSNPDIEFILWTVNSDRKLAKVPLYELPSNVVELREIFLEDAYAPSKRHKRIDPMDATKVIEALSTVMADGQNNWEGLFELCKTHTFDSGTLGNSESFLNYAVSIATESNGTIGLSDAYYGLKSMILPLYFLMQQDVPEADLYHAAVTGYGGILGAMAKHITIKPFILTEHGIYPREREEELLQAEWVIPSLRNIWITMFYNLSKCAYLYADKVTSLFKAAMDKQIEIGCSPEKCVIVANGIHNEKFINIKPRKESDAINIGAFLRFAPIKDIKTLIYAFFELSRKVSNVHLYLLGGTDDEEYKRECMALIDRLKIENIHIEGHVDTVEYMSKMDFTVMSSISEGQPLAILESLAAAKPCVTTNVGNCKALLEGSDDNYGQAGYCCAPMDSVGLATAMERLCRDSNLRISFGNNGRNRVKNNYTHELMRKKYLRVYSEVV